MPQKPAGARAPAPREDKRQRVGADLRVRPKGREHTEVLPYVSAPASYSASLSAAKGEPRARVHSFHRYFGKLIPAIPRFAIHEFTKPGNLVLDPFCGSGTTLVEALLAGRRAIGLDLNPLAVLVTKAKTAPFDIPAALRARDRILAACESPSPSQGEGRVRVERWAGHSLGSEALAKEACPASARRSRAADVPYVPNMDHWFRAEVQRDLAILLRGIRRVRDGDARDFLLACFSAMLRDVSNADPRHIFPGYSKRLRALDAGAGRNLNVLASFGKVTDRRAAALAAMDASRAQGGSAAALCGDSRRIPLPDGAADLIVTNPPYISSIRYLETMKLEMYWLGIVDSREAYFALDRRGVGTERLRVAARPSCHSEPQGEESRNPVPLAVAQGDNLCVGQELVHPEPSRRAPALAPGGRDTPVAPGGARVPRPPLPGALREAPLPACAEITVRLLHAGHPKMAGVVARYFADMSEALGEMARVLRRGGHLVMKISDSHVRGVDVPTHALLAELAQERGLRLIEQFTDEIRSRSLLTKRNWYSGMIAHDWILIFRRSTPAAKRARVST